jgi:hypothetical protein
MFDLTQAARLTRILVAVASALSAAEYIALRSQFAEHGIFADHVHACKRSFRAPALEGIKNTLYSRPVAVGAYSIQFILSVLLFAPISDAAYSWILLAIIGIIEFGVVRSGIGFDGSDQMIVVTMVPLSIMYAVHLSGVFALIGVWFLAMQTFLAYGAAGISKLVSPAWRNGSAVGLIFNTACYGSPESSRLLRRFPLLLMVSCWSIISFECSMPLVLVVPHTVALVMLGIGVLFHLGCAAIMGLNGFFWAFVATYPILYFCNVHLSVSLTLVCWAKPEELAVASGLIAAALIVTARMSRFFITMREE